MNEKQFKNLCLEGGGVKGIAYAGALMELERRGIVSGLERVAGTSAGAITAALVALGADGAAIRDIVGGTRFREFMDDSFGVVRDAKRFFDSFGWYAGEAFSAWIQKQVYALTSRPSLTFAQLAEFAAKDARYKELFVIGTNLSSGIPIVFSAETTPDEPIWRAVRISMSIPLFFASMRLEPLRQVMVDGGVSWNYPLDLFDEPRYVSVREAAREVDYPTKYPGGHIYNKETLGIRVDTKDEIEAELQSLRRPPAEINDFFDYVKSLIGFMLDMANKAHLHKDDWQRTIFVDANGVKATDFGITDEQVNKLVANGEAGVKTYFDWWGKGEALNVVKKAGAGASA